MTGRKTPRERALAHMRKLAIASVVVGACHHRGEVRPDEYGGPGYDPVAPRDGPGIDPVPEPANIPPTNAAPGPNAVGNVQVETAWLNARQLVVHVSSNERLLVPTVTSKSRSVDATTGAVPHLKPSGAAPASPTTPARQDAHTLPPIAVVHEAVQSSPTERWLILRELAPNEEILLGVAFADGGAAEPFTLRMPQALGSPVQVTRTP